MPLVAGHVEDLYGSPVVFLEVVAEEVGNFQERTDLKRLNCTSQAGIRGSAPGADAVKHTEAGVVAAYTELRQSA